MFSANFLYNDMKVEREKHSRVNFEKVLNKGCRALLPQPPEQQLKIAKI